MGVFDFADGRQSEFAHIGDPSLKYDDNGWIFAVKGAYLSRALQPDPECEKEKEKVKTMFWGTWVSNWRVQHSPNCYKQIRVVALERDRHQRSGMACF